MDEVALKQFVDKIMRLTPKGFLEIPDTGEDMVKRLRESAAMLWRAAQERDTEAFQQHAHELEGQLMAAQSVNRLSASEARELLDELQNLAS